MIHPRFLKNLPAPIRTLVRPMLFISLGVHGLLLIMPIPSQEQVELPAEQKPVKITQIPPVPSPQPSPTVRLPTPSPQAQQNTPPLVKPSPQLRQRTPLVIEPSPKKRSPEPESSPVEEQNTPAPAPPTATPPADTTSSETSTPPPTPPEEPTPSPTPTPEQPFADFRHYTGAESTGCSNSLSCWRVAGTQWRQVAKDLAKIDSQEYEIKDLNLGDDYVGGYEVLKDGERQYYLYLHNTAEGTVYILTKEKLSVEQLREMAQS